VDTGGHSSYPLPSGGYHQQLMVLMMMNDTDVERRLLSLSLTGSEHFWWVVCIIPLTTCKPLIQFAVLESYNLILFMVNASQRLPNHLW